LAAAAVAGLLAAVWPLRADAAELHGKALSGSRAIAAAPVCCIVLRQARGGR